MSSLWSSLGFGTKVEDEGDGLFIHDRLEPWEEELYDSIQHKRVEECEHLLRKLIDPNIRDRYGKGLLLAAVEVGSLEWTERLLLMGANPSMWMPRSRTLTYLDIAERNSKMYPFDSDRKMIVKLMNLAYTARVGSPYAFPVVYRKTSGLTGRVEERGQDGGVVSGADEKSIGGDEEDESEEGSEYDGTAGSLCDTDLASSVSIKDGSSPLLAALAGELRRFRSHVDKQLGSITTKLNQLSQKVDVLSTDTASLKGDTETLIEKVDVLSTDTASLKGDTETLIDNASIRGTAITDLRTEVAYIKSLLESNEEEEDVTSSNEDSVSREEVVVDQTQHRNDVLRSSVVSVTSPNENNATPTSGLKNGAVNSTLDPGSYLVGHGSQACGVVSGAEVAGVAVGVSANSKQCSTVPKTAQTMTVVRKLNQQEEDNRGSKSVTTVRVVDNESNPAIDPKDLAACVGAFSARSTIFGPTNVHHSLPSYYKRIFCQGPLTSGMLKYLRSQGNVTIHVDFSQSNLSKMVPNLKDLDGSATKGGKQKVYVNTSKRRVYVGAKPDGQAHSVDHVVGWLAIALTRLCIFLAFKNNCRPYENNNEEKRREFEVIVAEAEKALRSPVCNFYITNAMKWKTADGRHVALISAVPGIIAHHGQWAGVNILQKQVPSLLQFYRENVLPKFKSKGQS